MREVIADFCHEFVGRSEANDLLTVVKVAFQFGDLFCSDQSSSGEKVENCYLAY